MIMKALIKNKELRERIKSSSAVIDFGPNVNIIVGPNGSGKTTLLKCLSDLTGRNKHNITIKTAGHSSGMYHFPNYPRDVPQAYIDDGKSIGEVLWNNLNVIINKDVAIVLIDNPEIGLDYLSVIKFKMRLLSLNKIKKKQVIITSNHPLLIDPIFNLVGLGRSDYLDSILLCRELS